MPSGRWLRRGTAIVVAVGLVATVGWYWYRSLTPATYSMMDMGYTDLGSGPPAMSAMPGMAGMEGPVSVKDLAGPAGRPDVAVTLVAQQGPFRLASGAKVTGYTLNGQSPGPIIRVRQGDLVEVTLVNDSVRNGVTLHWHGVNVPNAEDGVAGVTQDAVRPGHRFVYRFRVEDTGTYWYHSHQDSHEQVPGGLFGMLIVDPRSGPAPGVLDVVAAVHRYNGRQTVTGHTGRRRVAAASGTAARVRIGNTDDGPLIVSVSGASYRVLAHDGRDVNAPTEVTGRSVRIPAGSRVDLGLRVPPDGSAVLVDLGGGTGLVIGPPDAEVPVTRTAVRTVDLLSYGSPAPIGFDPTKPDRRFTYSIGRRPGFLSGRPGLWWSINAHLYPDIPMFTVSRGDVVLMTIKNSSANCIRCTCTGIMRSS